uniref:Ovule protein n=1 Tax=Hymenolepis diminuta TaxID=6216 RepID=A0A0R3SSU7_HYMDI
MDSISVIAHLFSRNTHARPYNTSTKLYPTLEFFGWGSILAHCHLGIIFVWPFLNRVIVRIFTFLVYWF